MFSQVEENYIKNLVSRYYEEGYTYYLCHTITEDDDDFDVYIYFSKEEINAVDSLSFELTNALLLKLDSSSMNSLSTNSRIDLADNDYSGILVVNHTEFIYTNANVLYETTFSVIHPDINYGGSSFYVAKYNVVTIMILVIIFVYIFVKDILHLRK